MGKKVGSPYSFVGGIVLDTNKYLFLGQYDDIEEMSSVIKYDLISKKKFFFNIYFDATHICMFGKTVYVTGIEGVITIFDVNGMLEAGDEDDEDYFNEEEIDSSDNGIETYGDIRELRSIGKHLYAVGMGRQVYRRDGEKLWRHIDKAVLDNQDNIKTVEGFNSIDGFSESTFIAAGFNGGVWRCVKNKWNQLHSPTNVILNKVKAVQKDVTYVCGKGGTLLMVRKDRIEIVDHQSTDEEMWGLEWFNGSLYISTLKNIYILKNDNTLDRVVTGMGSITFGKLTKNNGQLMSIGDKDVCVTDDGILWKDITIRYKK